MELSIADKNNTRKEISVKLAAEEVNRFFREVTAKISSDVKVPGFRQGKVPPHILELRLGKKLRAEVLEEMFKRAFGKIRSEENIKPAGYPEIDSPDKLPEKNKDFAFNITLDIMPEVIPGQYKGITLEKEKIEITDAMTDNVFQREQEKRAGLVSAEGRPVRKEDRVTVEGERVEEDGEKNVVHESIVPVGEGSLPPEIEEGLLGAEIGQTKEISVKNPGGKTSRYILKVKGIQEKRKIITGNNFAKDAGYASEEEWKEDIKKNILAEAENKVNREMKFKALDTIVDSSKADLPESMVRSQMDYFRKIYAAMGRETGEPADETKIRELAERQVKEHFVLEKIAEAENITVTDQEIAARKDEMSASRGASATVDNDEILYALKREKVISFVLENAVVKDKEKPLILKPDEVNLVSER